MPFGCIAAVGVWGTWQLSKLWTNAKSNKSRHSRGIDACYKTDDISDTYFEMLVIGFSIPFSLLLPVEFRATVNKGRIPIGQK